MYVRKCVERERCKKEREIFLKVARIESVELGIDFCHTIFGCLNVKMFFSCSRFFEEKFEFVWK